MFDSTTGILVTACPDEVLVSDEGHLALDYKTASYTDTARDLFPLYVAQISIECMIGIEIKLLTPIAGALLYLEPIRGQSVMDGPALGFLPLLKPVELDLGLPARLLRHAKEIMDMVNAGELPPSRIGCPNCAIARRFIQLLMGLHRDDGGIPIRLSIPGGAMS